MLHGFDSLRVIAYGASEMLEVLESPSAAARIVAATEFTQSFTPGTELIVVGSSREAVDDLLRGLAQKSGATFGLHRFSLPQFAARLSLRKLAAEGVVPSSAIGADAIGRAGRGVLSGD